MICSSLSSCVGICVERSRRLPLESKCFTLSYPLMGGDTWFREIFGLKSPTWSAIQEIYIALIYMLPNSNFNCFHILQLDSHKTQDTFGASHSDDLHNRNGSDNEVSLRLLRYIHHATNSILFSVTVTVDAICLLTMPHNWIFIGRVLKK